MVPATPIICILVFFIEVMFMANVLKLKFFDVLCKGHSRAEVLRFLESLKRLYKVDGVDGPQEMEKT